VVENQNVITKVYFPRLILPVAAVVVGFGGFGDWTGRDGGVDAFFGIHPPGTVVLLPVLIVLAVLTALGVGLWTSALNALYRDVRAVMPFVVQFWMLASPVAYPSSLVPARWRWLYGLNPMAGVIDGFSVGADRARAATRRRDGSLRDRRLRGAAGRAVLLPANGNEYRRPRLESSDALCFGQLRSRFICKILASV